MTLSGLLRKRCDEGQRQPRGWRQALSVPALIVVAGLLPAACAGDPTASAILSGITPRDGTPADRARRDAENVRAIEEAKRQADREKRHREMEREFRDREIARERGWGGSDGGGGGGY